MGERGTRWLAIASDCLRREKSEVSEKSVTQQRDSSSVR